MRAVQTSPRNHVFAGRGLPASYRAPHQQSGPCNAGGPGVFAGYAAAFLLGYIPGILAGYKGQSVWGQQLAAYYTDMTRVSAWPQIFAGQMAGAFLQLAAVLLCGFSVLGGALLVLVFMARGGFFGFCAANVLAGGGTRSLVLYWLLDCLPGLAVLFAGLWLACYAVQLSGGLFQSVFLGGAPRGRLAACARRLLVRGGAALLLCGIFSVLSASLNLLIVGLLF